MNRLRRTCLALTVALGLPLATAGVSTAAAANTASAQATSQSPTAAAACPGEGQRVKKASESRVYIVGPNLVGDSASDLYYIPSATDYLNLYGTWDGIITLPDREFNTCFFNGSTDLTNAQLAKASNTAAVYIWVGELEAYFQIRDWNTFTNKYHFDPSKIGPVVTNRHFSSRYWS
ncbi:hypothetical protein [Streptomyces sp. S.PB5]|uniref:hypothetical protein n=1 Tax=Streptomyces sp. S.PB5 TaxID=3020844 RepID=UPI0025AF997C|nr:hypothetical protein [Streptomyces sp. S.PB5]MDN3023983.1 hypothetical protein [Streptomyces sp. S.PB5]